MVASGSQDGHRGSTMRYMHNIAAHNIITYIHRDISQYLEAIHARGCLVAIRPRWKPAIWHALRQQNRAQR